MLSEKSTIYSNPQLEINTDDVSCKHGSTTGQLDDDVIFYMLSRGLSIQQSKKILLNGFIKETLKTYNTLPYNKIINELLTNKLNNVIS